ncbi:MAG: prolipoprotein diacylglyceryl transferase, partial [Lewinella sp.]|nr:prolipoprotein diacylglyceryl transferase [Lewinella sp.]
MYPDLSYFFHDLLGTPVDNWLGIFKTFGLLVVSAIIVAALILRAELRRRAEAGQFPPSRAKVITSRPLRVTDYVLNALFGFVIGFKLLYIIQHTAEMKADPGDVLLSLKGHWLAGLLGALAFLGYYYWRDGKARALGEQSEMRDIYPHDRLTEIATVAVISGVIGAKVFTVIEDLPSFFANPLGTLFSGDGWTIYGGLIGGFVGVSWLLKRKNIPALPVFDAVAPALIVAYGVGRLGCHFAGDGDWGIVAAAQPGWWFLPDWLWAFDYPRNVLNEGVLMQGCTGDFCHHLVPPVYPTPLYETMAAFGIGGILWG